MSKDNSLKGERDLAEQGKCLGMVYRVDECCQNVRAAEGFGGWPQAATKII